MRRLADWRRWTIVTVVLLGPPLGGGQELRAADGPDASLPVGSATAAELPGLHNVFRLSGKLYTGSAPEGEAGFRTLQRLGIRTILSVDGMPPDGNAARHFGMRAVHLPFGYDGCPRPQADRIARAVRDLPGPVYLHCHHGKHRAPTAAAFARIALDGISNEDAVREMERAGTGKYYRGLYGDVRAYRAPASAALDEIKPDFPETAPTPPMARAMVQVDARFGPLTLAQKAGWAPLKAQSGLKPEDEALQLRELFAELNRTPEVQKRPKDFRRWMKDAESSAAGLEGALRAGDAARADRFLGRVAAGCGSCHAKYRNVPQ